MLVTSDDVSRQFGRCTPSSIVEHGGHLVRYHQSTAPHIDRKFSGDDRFSQRLRLNKRVSQKCFAICAANKCRRVECRSVITSRRCNQKSIQSAATGATVKRMATNSSSSSRMMSSGSTWFSSKGADHDVQELRCRCLLIHAERVGPRTSLRGSRVDTVAQRYTHTRPLPFLSQLAFGLPGLLSKTSAASRSLDGIEEVF